MGFAELWGVEQSGLHGCGVGGSVENATNSALRETKAGEAKGKFQEEIRTWHKTYYKQ